MKTNTSDPVVSTGRKILVLCLSLFFSGLLYGAEVDSLTAKLVAKNFYLSRVEQSGAYLKKGPILDISFELVHKETGDPGNPSLLKSGGVPLPLYYVFNAGEEDGYVIVPGDDRAPAVLGFSFEGSYSEENQPPAFVDWMESYSQQLTYIIENDLEGSEENLEMWENYEKGIMDSALKAVGDVSPLIETRWNQGEYYNSFCPEDPEGPDGHVYVGCLAVAVAQILNYWEYPAHVDNIPGYSHPTYGWIAEINDIDYNWSAMTSTLSSSSSQQAVDAVAGLLYHVGVADQMNYSPKGSAGSSSRALYALQNIFNYASTSEFISDHSYSNSEWDQIIRNELDLDRPVYSQGSNEGGGCHAFVLDGYSGTNYFHINWGWGGYRDGYFYLDPLSENSSLYPLRQWIFVGLEPYNLDVSPDSRTVSSNAGTTSYTVNASMDWNVEDDASWLTATRDNSTTISVSYSANTTGSSRTAHIRAYGTGGIEETVTLTQGPGDDCRDAFEPNEYFPSAASAYPTLGASSYTGSISATMDVADDQDYYRLNITSLGTLTVRLTDPPVDIDMALAFGPEDWLTNSLGVGTSDETMTWEVTETGSYHIYAYAAYDEYSCGNYTLEVQWTPTSTGELWISPDSRNVGSDFGSTSFAVTSSVAWNVEDDASWLTATNIDNHTISVSFAENFDPGSRTAHIRAYAPGGLEDNVTVVQDGTGSSCPDAYEENNSFGTAASPYPTLGASNYSGSINATIHNASDDDYYRVYISSTGTLTVNMPSPPIDIDIQLANGSGTWLTNSVNTGINSESMTWHVGSTGYYYIFAYGYDGVSSCTEYQLDVVWNGGGGLDVSPNSQSVSYPAGTITYTVTSDADWNVEDNASWLTATRINSSTISVSYSENTGSTRVANIRVYASGGLEETVTLTQFGNTQSCLDSYEPNEYFNEAASPYPTLGASSYTGSISATIDDAEDQDYFRLNLTELGTLTVNMYNPPIDIDMALAAGTEEWLTNSLGVGTSSETMTWEVTETGSYHIYAYAAYDDYTCDNYSLEVQWAPEEPEFLGVSPSSRTVSHESGCVTFSVSSNVNWSVENDASWLTVTKTNNGTITVCFDENATSSSRTANIRAWYGSSLEQIVTITQLELRLANLTYHPDYNDLSVSGTVADLSIRILNDGGASAQASNVAYYLSTDATISTSDYLIGEDYVSSILAGNYSDESLDVDVTSANSEIPGGTYYVGYIIDYLNEVEESSESDNRYLFNSPRITVPVHMKVSPESKTVEYPSGNTGFSVSSNVDWSVSDDADWLTATKTSESALGVSYTENTSTTSRTAYILVTGNGETETVSLVQLGASYPNLVPYKHTGWDDKIIISTQKGTRTSGELREDEPAYIDVGWMNIGNASAGSHVTCLYLDDQQIKWIDMPGLSSGSYVFEEDMEYTFSEGGIHTIKLVVDVNKSVFESEEGDNEYEKQINVIGVGTDNPTYRDEIKVYPNPTGGWINLKIEGAKEGRYSMEIVDAVGKVVWNWQVDNQGTVLEERINLNDNPAGIYFIRVTNETDTRVRKIILKD